MKSGKKTNELVRCRNAENSTTITLLNAISNRCSVPQKSESRENANKKGKPILAYL